MVTTGRGEYITVGKQSCVHVIVARVLQGDVPQDSVMPLTGIWHCEIKLHGKP
jgi:hypothetical protein